MRLNEFNDIILKNPTNFQLCFSNVTAVRKKKSNIKIFSKITELKNINENVIPFYKDITRII